MLDPLVAEEIEEYILAWSKEFRGFIIESTVEFELTVAWEPIAVLTAGPDLPFDCCLSLDEIALRTVCDEV